MITHLLGQFAHLLQHAAHFAVAPVLLAVRKKSATLTQVQKNSANLMGRELFAWIDGTGAKSIGVEGEQCFLLGPILREKASFNQSLAQLCLSTGPARDLSPHSTGDA